MVCMSTRWDKIATNVDRNQWARLLRIALFGCPPEHVQDLL